jgi:Kef-type K+ transport system membrane component KefB
MEPGGASAIIDAAVALRDLLNEHALFAVGALLVIGYGLGKLAALVRLPEITGFIIAGILMGESVTGIVPRHMGEDLQLITEVALGLIAVTIGGEFYAAKLRRLGKAIVSITLLQIVATFVIVTAALMLFRMALPFALLMGAIASATAPAATVAIVQSLRAQGKFVDYLYGVVALDDAGAVILFGVTFAVVSGIIGSVESHGIQLAYHAVAEVFLSIALGLVIGFLIHLFVGRQANANEVMILTLGMLFISTAMAIVFELSPLLTNMAAGTAIINLAPRNHRIFRILEPFTPPVYALFFVIAGTELRPDILAQGEILLLGGVYIIARAIGKYGGVYVGAAFSGVEPEIKRNLGTCMLPQAGVAIGLVLVIQASPLTRGLPPESLRVVDMMVNIILFSVFVNEILGPPLARAAIIRGNRLETA